MDMLKSKPGAPHMRLFTDKTRDGQTCGQLRESGLGATAFVPGEPDTWPGWEDSAVAPGEAGQLSARSARAVQQVRIQPRTLRPLWAGLHPLPRRLRSHQRAGNQEVALVHGRGHRPVREVRRQPQRRTWRWSGARRVPLQDVRRGVDSGLPRVQVHLGSGLEDESRQGRSTPTAWTRTCGSAPTTIRGSPRRISSFRRMAAASRMPRCAASASANAAGKDGKNPERRHHVSQLHGDPRRAAHHPRPRSYIVGDAERQRHPERLEGRSRQRSARPVPLLQGLQRRLPGQRRHGDLQGGVPLALLGRRVRPRSRLCLWLDRSVVAAGVGGSRIRQSVHPASGAERDFQEAGWHSSAAADSGIRRRAVQGHGSASAGARAIEGEPARSRSGPTPSTTTSSPRPRRPRSKCSSTTATRCRFPCSICAADGRSTTTASSASREEYLQDVLHALADDIEAGTPMVVLEPSCCSVFRDELNGLMPESARGASPDGEHLHCCRSSSRRR